MPNPDSPHNIVDTLKGAVEVGGPKELNALSDQLNKMSYKELESLSRAMPYFNQMEQQAHPGLPTVDMGGHGAGNQTGWEMQGFSMETVAKDGSEKTLYNRDFEINHGVTTDVKYEAGSEKVASRTVIPVESVPPFQK
jgi:hypothetical protein